MSAAHPKSGEWCNLCDLLGLSDDTLAYRFGVPPADVQRMRADHRTADARDEALVAARDYIQVEEWRDLKMCAACLNKEAEGHHANCAYAALVAKIEAALAGGIK